MGGFIGDDDTRLEWIGERVGAWEMAIIDLASIADKFPQSVYSGLQRSLQQEWQFLQRVTNGIGSEFKSIEETLSQFFLPALFGDTYEDDDPRRDLSCLPVKWAGMAIPDPTISADSNYDASILACSHILAAFRGADEFRSADHLSVIKEVKLELKQRKIMLHNTTLESLTSKLSCDDERTILRGRTTGQWLSVPPSTVNGTELSAQEFRDALLLRYARSPPDLPSHCDGCLQKFSVRHALECKTGGLVICRHNEIRDELIDLASKAFCNSAVRDEPFIHSGRNSAKQLVDEKISNSVLNKFSQKSDNEDRGDVLIRGLWASGTDCIIDVRITDVDAKSNRSKDPMKVLAAHEREKKKKYLEPCLEQRRHFSPFVVSTDGLLGKEAKTLLKKLSAVLAAKWDKPYSQICGYVNARMSIAILRATHMCLRGSRVPTSRMSKRLPQWEDKAGLGLFQH